MAGYFTRLKAKYKQKEKKLYNWVHISQKMLGGQEKKPGNLSRKRAQDFGPSYQAKKKEKDND